MAVTASVVGPFTVNDAAVTTGEDADAAAASDRVEPPAEPKVSADVVNVAAADTCDTPSVAPSAAVNVPPPVWLDATASVPALTAVAPL